jgi:ribosome-associated toxin RatA of RatAB toxin-antitoxin module
MRFIKFGILSAVMIFLLFTGISLFIPSQVNISRAINLAAKADSVLQLVKDTNRWIDWYPGYDTMRSKGTSVNFIAVEANKIAAEFKGRQSKTISSTWQVIPYEHMDSITLHWNMQFNLKWYPWEKFGSLLYEKAYGTQMETGLNNLKAILPVN